ncbi:MAG: RelA/SpoT domain-containing protein [Nitrospirae bacterium]|nr:RelA/SpoT domain-containing protein [Nitrospirota bacterium]
MTAGRRTSIPEDIASIEKIRKDLKCFFDEFDMRLQDAIVNEQESRSLYFELETRIKIYLEKVFGKEGVTKDAGLSKYFLPYSHLKQIRYCDSVIFNYWSHQGELIETLISKDTGKWRENLFYKGKRWSNNDSKASFYKLFHMIKFACEGSTPIDFFTKYCVDCGTTCLVVKGARLDLAISNSGSHNGGQVVIPVLNNQGAGSHITITKSDKFRELIKLIADMKDNNEDKDECAVFIETNSINNEQVKKLMDEAFAEVIAENRQLLTDIKLAWIKGITTEKVKQDNLIDEIKLRDVFNNIVAYQYYDHPYDIHMYFPESRVQRPNPYACLVISVEEGNTVIHQFDNSFIEFANEIGQITMIERAIFNKQRDSLQNYYLWRKHYNEFADQYERLSNVVQNICLAVCKTLKMEVFSVPARLKTFDSFYNKIISRANGRDNAFPPISESVNETDWKTSVRSETLAIYRDKVKSPTKENADEIIGSINDIAGLRIICLFPEDKDKIIGEFDKYYKKMQITKPIIKKPDRRGGYSSRHLIFSLDDERCKLYEHEDLKGRKCEVQIRTILEQGWSDVSHMVYKPSSNILEEIKSVLVDKLADHSISLGTLDASLNHLLREHGVISW